MTTNRFRSRNKVGIERLEQRNLLAVLYPTFRVFQPETIEPLAAEDITVAAGDMTLTEGDVTASADVFSPLATASPTGTTPAVMRHAYGIDLAAFGAIVGDGTGQTIAIVDAYDEPTITSDLAAFDAFYGLPAPPTFTKINQTGGTTFPSADTKGGWGVETALDVEWAHAIAPKANILLVEANSANDSDLYAAVDTARNYAGVSVVSMSWGGDESSTDSASDFHFTTPSGHSGVTFVASSGDNGAYASSGSSTKIVGYPAVSPNVVSIGGTKLTTGTGGSYVSESGWGSGTSSNTNGGSGGGISNFFAKPSYQAAVTQSSTRRTVPDVSMDADPNSGVPVYSSYDNGSSTPWLQIGGTSLSAPMWGGVLAIANQGRVQNGLAPLNGPTQTLPKLYSLPSTSFHDITTGNNGYAAAAGYDLVTGLGTPIVNVLVNNLIDSTPAIGNFTSTPTSVGSGGFVTLSASNVTDSLSTATITAVKFYRESNSSSGLQIAADTLIGSGVASGTTWTLPVSTTGLSAGSNTYYAVATDSSGNSSTTSSATVTTTTAGFTNWSGIGQAIGLVSSGAGRLTNVSVVDFGSTIYTGALDVTKTLNRIRANTGSIDTNDGSIYANASGELPSANLWYEFVVSPTSGTDRNFSSVSFPGPMRMLLNNKGDVYFTGDHYSTFVPVYVQTQDPTIGSFAASPSSIIVGGSVALTASNVSQSGATISAVNFYRESNSVSGLQVGSDTFVGSGTQSNTTWALPSLATTGLAAGTYTYFAVATDSGGAIKVASSALTITVAASTGVLLAWNMTGQTAFGTQNLTAGTVATGITNTLGLTRGGGVTTSPTAAGDAWGGNGWATTSALGVSGNKFVTFGLTVAAGQTASLSSIDLNYRRSSSASPNGFWQYQINAGSWVDISDVAGEFSSFSSSGASMTQLNLSGIGGLQNLAAGTALNLRLVPYGATQTGGNWYIYDLTGNDLIVSGSIQAASTNAAPTALALSNNSIAENAVANANVGSFTTTDPDAGNTFTYTLVSGTGSTDNSSFNISGSTLRATSSFDFETKSSYSVRVRTTDQGGLFFEQPFTINVTDVIEAPQVTAPTSANIAATTATLGGSVGFDGGSAITERGVVYSLTSANSDPIIGGNGVTKVTTSGTTGLFTTNVTGLTSGSGYSYKAFATNSIGTSYSAVATYTTTATVTSLAAGDIAFTGYNGTTSTERVSFVVLRDIPSLTTVLFTDNGYSSASGPFNSTEGLTNVLFTSTVTAGTRFYLEGLALKQFDGSAAPATVTGTTVILSNSGDQITALQGTLANPTSIIASISSSSYALSGTIDSTTTYLPAGLTLGTTAISLGSATSNGVLNSASANIGVNVTGSQTNILGRVNNVNNWTVSTATNLTVPPAIAFNLTTLIAPTVTANLLTKVYDGASFSTLASADDGAGGNPADTTVGDFTYTYYAGPGLTGGVIPAPKNVGSYSVDVAYAGNVNYIPVASTSFNFTITPKALTVTADTKTKSAGSNDPALTFTASGFVGLDTAVSALTGALTRTAGETSGTYAITQGTLAAVAGNYDITYLGANFTINVLMISSVVVNGADTYIKASQRSQITSLVVTLSGQVTDPSTAFSIINRGLYTTSNLTIGSGQLVVTNVGNVYTIRFGAGTSVDSRLGTGIKGNSLADGNYELRVANGSNVFGETANDKFFRMFGDSDGDGDVDGTDTLAFRAAQSTNTYNAALDWDGNGSVSGIGVDADKKTANSGKIRRLF